MEKTDILKKYNEFKDMFINDMINLPFSKYKKWDHEIVLKPKIKFMFKLNYLLSAKELKVLKNI